MAAHQQLTECTLEKCSAGYSSWATGALASSFDVGTWNKIVCSPVRAFRISSSSPSGGKDRQECETSVKDVAGRSGEAWSGNGFAWGAVDSTTDAIDDAPIPLCFVKSRSRTLSTSTWLEAALLPSIAIFQSPVHRNLNVPTCNRSPYADVIGMPAGCGSACRDLVSCLWSCVPDCLAAIGGTSS